MKHCYSPNSIRFVIHSFRVVSNHINSIFFSPLPHIRWRKLDADLPPNYEVSMNGALLHLINVQYEDEGSYECETLNVKGMDWYRQWLYVEGNKNSSTDSGLVLFYVFAG